MTTNLPMRGRYLDTSIPPFIIYVFIFPRRLTWGFRTEVVIIMFRCFQKSQQQNFNPLWSFTKSPISNIVVMTPQKLLPYSTVYSWGADPACISLLEARKLNPFHAIHGLAGLDCRHFSNKPTPTYNQVDGSRRYIEVYKYIFIIIIYL